MPMVIYSPPVKLGGRGSILLLNTGQAGDARAGRPPGGEPLQRLQMLAGCWQGQRSDGRPEVLRIAPHDWGVEILSASGDAANCASADSLLAIERRDKSTVAYSRREPKEFGWMVGTTPDAILFAPTNAPVWMALKRVDADRLEWSMDGPANTITLTRVPSEN